MNFIRTPNVRFYLQGGTAQKKRKNQSSHHAVEYSIGFLKTFKKMRKKDKKRFVQCKNKIKEIIKNPGRFKALGNVLHGFYRVHIGPFVLVYEFDKKTLKFIKIIHHDTAYD